MQEVRFWQLRRSNVKNIYQQLLDPRVKAIASILESIDSVYTSTFTESFKNIVKALHEADDVTLWMKPLTPHFDSIERDEFLENEDKIHPLYHVICLMWAHSKYYGSNKRMIVLFRMISNMIIESSTKFLDPGSLFQGEPDESLNVLTKVINILEKYKSCFKEYREKLSSYALPEKNSPPWSFYPKDIFERFDVYMNRLYTIKGIFEKAYEFFKSEKIELGGVRGRYLTRCMQEITAEFRIVYAKWTQIQFDPLDPDPRKKHFKIQLKIFERESEILERRMAAVVVQTFDECFTLESFIKFMEICSSLLLRPLIHTEISYKLNTFMELYYDDLDLVKDTFNNGVEIISKQGLEELPVDRGFPPTSGALVWAKRMKIRISKPQEEFPNIEIRSIFDCEKGRMTQERYLEMVDILEAFEIEIYDNWKEKVPTDISRGMDKFLLLKNKDGRLEMNFDIELVTAMKEIRNLKSYGKTDLPDIANELHEHSDNLWVSMNCFIMHSTHCLTFYFSISFPSPHLLFSIL